MTPTGALQIGTNEAKYIDEGRALFRQRFPIGSFDDPSWDIRHLRSSQHKAANARVYFTRYGSTKDSLPPAFARVVKAFVLLSRASCGTMPLRVDAARMLWKAIERRLGITAADFNWGHVTEEDILKAEQQMLQHWSKSATYRRCTMLQHMLRALAAAPYGPIVRPISVTFRTPRQEDFERYTIEGQELRQAKMPPDEAIYAIGDLFHKLVTDPHERLIVCGLAIMLATGFRVGEVLTLPLDCEVTEGRGQRCRYGLRFHKEKSIGGQKQLAVRWMTPKQAELAKAAAAELRRLTTRGSQASKDSRVPTRNGASPGCTSECGFESRASGCVSWVPAPERNVPSRNSPAEAFCERLARCHLQGKRCHEVPAFDSGPVVGRGPSGRHAPTAVGNAIHPVPQCGSRDA